MIQKNNKTKEINNMYNGMCKNNAYNPSRIKNKKKPLDTLKKINNFDFDKIYNKMCPNDVYIPSILGAKKRIVVFGDIHGDLKLAIKFLTISKVAKIIINGDDIISEWIGGETFVVQIGDQIDRCRPINSMLCEYTKTTPNDESSDIKILELFTELHKQAIKVGGGVISLLGNHEILNSFGLLNYVSYEGLKQFENYTDPSNKQLSFNSGWDARKHAFAPGNEYGKLLGCTRVPAIIIGSNLFVHAGIVDGLIHQIGLNGLTDLETINKSIRLWLFGLLNEKYISNIVESTKYSMFWTRILGKIPPNTDINENICKNNIKNVLKLFKINGMIIGHTPQSFVYSDDINSTCSNKIWRVDNGSSAAFDRFDESFLATGDIDNSRRAQYIEILNDTQFNVCDENGCKISK